VTNSATKTGNSMGKGAKAKNSDTIKLSLSSSPSISTRSKTPQQSLQALSSKEADIIHHSKNNPPLHYQTSNTGHLKRKFSNAFISKELDLEDDPFDEEAEFPY
jgi:hypothetical protein